jgi:hypothetical protein
VLAAISLAFCLGVGQVSFLCPSFCFFFSYLCAFDLVVARFDFG